MALLLTPALFISGATTLASAIWKIWEVLEQRRDRQDRRLDRDQQFVLEQARFHHDLAIAEKQRYLLEIQIRHEERLAAAAHQQHQPQEQPQGSADGAVSVPNQVLLERLNVEAERLAEFDFDVIYESINDSYGLALTMGDYLTFAFLLTPEYPREAPFLLLKRATEIDQIPVSADGWTEETLLIDIVSQIVAAYLPDFPEEKTAEAPESTPPEAGTA